MTFQNISMNFKTFSLYNESHGFLKKILHIHLIKNSQIYSCNSCDNFFLHPKLLFRIETLCTCVQLGRTNDCSAARTSKTRWRKEKISPEKSTLTYYLSYRAIRPCVKLYTSSKCNESMIDRRVPICLFAKFENCLQSFAQGFV